MCGEYESEKVIEKSRFLAYSAHVESEEEARAFVRSLREKHPFATHVCFAFVADEAGNLMRFSDDGEPSGTAGQPILEAIRAKNLVETAVAVVRYFGGIKLGAGGLTRAYSSSASENLSGADIRTLFTAEEYLCTVSYPLVPTLERWATDKEILEKKFENEVSVRLLLKKDESARCLDELKNATFGRVKIEKTGEYSHAFENGK